MRICDWPTSEQPREKLIRKGPEHLSDAELITLFLRTGTHDKNAMDIARELLNKFGSLTGLLNSQKDELMQTPGIGVAKYSTLQAILEIAKRCLLDEIVGKDVLKNTKITQHYLKARLSQSDKELFFVLFLNNRNEIIGEQILASGTIDSASIYPREVVKACLFENAAAVIFAHNHPSGSLTPSNADQKITKDLIEALNTVDIRVFDHVIVSSQGTVSMTELGMI